MSTTFEVYPKLPYIPSFNEVLTLATTKLREFLQEFDIPGTPSIEVIQRTEKRHVLVSFDPTTPARWSENTYAFFYVPPIPGGTDAYFHLTDKSDRDVMRREMLSNTYVPGRRKLVKACMKQGYYWYFRRSAGQPAIINVAYGMIAAAFAQLTEGVIYSSDGAWDYKRFPATAAEFYTWYFRPEQAWDPDRAWWAEMCINSLREHLLMDLDPSRSPEETIEAW